ncbi:FUSC family protein [Hyphomicrobium sp.]|uniref:FUSC family protein n=1 Tax=Hyphomicrobium sp. TaxID=82 RepID=UPI000F9A8036|nr:FUSC family protein [Hyphomicrobium sp.]RUO97514.1 MAG: FUSC family protein [Hyphomicrobium sp.]
MNPPTLQQWVFSLKTLTAALLALFISLWIPLPNPYWSVATVYIASNPLSGATRSKAIFRVLGTLLGASAAVIILPNLANAPVLSVIALALWSSACLYLAMLDRTPRSYVFMLAGYTAALVGFPTVNAPSTIFDVALARTEEIIVGILCAAVVSSIIFPRSVAPAIYDRLKGWLADADTSAADALRMKTGADADTHRLKLAGDTGEIENLATHLIYDAAGHPEFIRRIREVHPRMLMLIPVLDAISDRLLALKQIGEPSANTRHLVNRFAEWFQHQESKGARGLDELRGEITAAIDLRRARQSWLGLVELSLLMRLSDLAAICADCLEVVRSVYLESAAPLRPLTYTLAGSAASVHHRDHGLALLSAVVSFATITIACMFWIQSSWPEGGAAVMMAAVSGNLFSAQDNPVPSIVVFAKWAVVAVFISAAYVFLILPNVHNFETLSIALTPTLILFGLCISKAETLLVGLSLAINFAAMVGLQQTFNVDAASFLNNAIAMSCGVIAAAIIASLLRALGAEWSIRRLADANKRTLGEITDIESKRDDTRLTAIMLDRLILLAPRAKAAGHRIPGPIRDLRQGFNILDLRRSREGLSSYSRRRVDGVLQRLKRCYQNGFDPQTSDLLCAAITRALIAVSGERSDSANMALLGLVGLQRSLFPDRQPTCFPMSPAYVEAAE